jgi:transposase
MYEVTTRDAIRDWVLVQGHSQRAAATRFGVSRDTVARLLREEPSGEERRYRRQVPRRAPLREAALPHIQGRPLYPDASIDTITAGWQFPVEGHLPR